MPQQPKPPQPKRSLPFYEAIVDWDTPAAPAHLRACPPCTYTIDFAQLAKQAYKGADYRTLARKEVEHLLMRHYAPGWRILRVAGPLTAE